jgi:hypothetical protein
MAVPTVDLGESKGPELLSIVSREEIGELFDIFFENSESALASSNGSDQYGSGPSRADDLQGVSYARPRSAAEPVPLHRVGLIR